MDHRTPGTTSETALSGGRCNGSSIGSSQTLYFRPGNHCLLENLRGFPSSPGWAMAMISWGDLLFPHLPRKCPISYFSDGLEAPKNLISCLASILVAVNWGDFAVQETSPKHAVNPCKSMIETNQLDIPWTDPWFGSDGMCLWCDENSLLRVSTHAATLGRNNCRDGREADRPRKLEQIPMKTLGQGWTV